VLLAARVLITDCYFWKALSSISAPLQSFIF
jgi:hypothetical protein